MIKLFEDFNEIHDICKKYNIKNYTINTDGSIDVDGNIDLYDSLTQLPLIFNRVSGDFNCSDNQLTTLQGSPKYVGGTFYCSHNALTSLDSSPGYVGRHFNCKYNKLKTLKGAPNEIKGNFLYHINSSLPKPILDNKEDIKYIIANQDDYDIWNKDDSFNEIRFNMLMKEKDL